MASTKKYSSPLEMLSSEHHTEISDVRERVEEMSVKSTLSDQLLLFRNMLGLSEEDMAERGGLSVEFIREVENKYDPEILLNDLGIYFYALNLQMTLHVHDKNESLVDQVKFHVSCIEEIVNHLVEICQGDLAMEKSARRFLKDFDSKVVKMVEAATAKLESTPEAPHVSLFPQVLLQNLTPKTARVSSAMSSG